MFERAQKLFTNQTPRRKKLVVGGFIALLALGAYMLFGSSDTAITEEPASLPTVAVKPVAQLASVNDFSVVGTVTAIAEARLQTESGGRVVSVNTEIGAAVRAGQILAVIENSAQRASLIQAEGAYEAARAGALQSDSGTRDAGTTLTNAREGAAVAVQNAYTAVNAALINSIDQFFSQPQTAIPGLRIDGNTPVLNAERIAYQSLMPRWQSNIQSISPTELSNRLDEAEKNVQRTITYVEQFIAATDNADRTDRLNDLPVSSYTAGLLSESERLNVVLRALQTARTTLASAEEGVVRAEVGGTDSAVSLANAQVKQALGSLRAAQAAYEKTLVRTPISGVVNALYLKAGQYVSPSQSAAIVANNNGLEIATAINQEDSTSLAVGDAVIIDDTASGTITAIAGAIDPTTGKIAVKVSVDDTSTLQNGSTVTITFTKENVTESAPITIPLSAIKMTGSGPITFTINDDQTLAARPVSLGQVSGNSVVVTDGLSLDTQIVVDARGLKEGQTVTVNAK